MNFHEGDSVMHWTYGLGQILNLEERTLFGSKILYYAVKVHDLTVWVPSDKHLSSRLRRPTSASKFKQLQAILSGPSEPLPDDWHARRLHLRELMRGGRAASLCQVIRDLSARKAVSSLNDFDQAVLREARAILLGEWEHAMSISHMQAELELHRLLNSGSTQAGV
ncbi:MAG TPA: CarD family transcriptional regulator [Anaerolineales bacterium]